VDADAVDERVRGDRHRDRGRQHQRERVTPRAHAAHRDDADRDEHEAVSARGEPRADEAQRVSDPVDQRHL
jgi:hypothetical protein